MTAERSRTFVHAKAFWSAALRDYAVRRHGGIASAGQACIDLQGEIFAGEVSTMVSTFRAFHV